MKVFYLLLLVTIAVAASAYEKSEVVSSVTQQQLVEVLTTNGFGFELIEGRDNLIRVVISGMKGAVLMDGTSLKFAYALETKTKSADQVLQAVNQWNLEKRFSRSYMDRDGDAVLDLDLDMDGGVTYQRLEDFLATVTKSVLAWTMHMANYLKLAE